MVCPPKRACFAFRGGALGQGPGAPSTPWEGGGGAHVMPAPSRMSVAVLFTLPPVCALAAGTPPERLQSKPFSLMDRKLLACCARGRGRRQHGR